MKKLWGVNIMSVSVSDRQKDFYLWLENNKPKKMMADIRTTIGTLNILFKKNKTINFQIFNINSLDEISNLIKKIKNSEGIKIHSRGYRTAVLNALYTYKEYLDTNCSNMNAKDRINSLKLCSEEKEFTKISVNEQRRIRATLEMHFKYGFKDDEVERRRFRRFYFEINSMDCLLEDDKLFTAIRKMGFEFQDKIYLVSDNEIQNIKQSIEALKIQGTNIIYYELLYNLKSNDYFEAKIMSYEMLKAIVKKIFPCFRYKSKYFVLVQRQQNEFELIENDIMRVWGQDVLLTFDELSERLPLIPIDKIKYTLSQKPNFIWNSLETYVRFDDFEADENEIKKLVAYIYRGCEKHGGISFDEIPFDNLKAMNPNFSDTAFKKCFFRIIENEFEINKKILTRKGLSIDIHTAITEFCQKHEKCTYDELLHIAERITGTKNYKEIIEVANTVMVRIDKDNFIAESLVKFDVNRIDEVLDHIIKADFMGMKEFTTFSLFPYCEYSWNLFLLESYCRRFSKKYKYVARQSNSSNSGAIVAK